MVKNPGQILQVDASVSQSNTRVGMLLQAGRLKNDLRSASRPGHILNRADFSEATIFEYRSTSS